MPLPTPGIVSDPAIERALQDIRNRVPEARNIYTPSSVAAGITWTVPSGMEMFFGGVLDVQGTLDVQGQLISVDLNPVFDPVMLHSGQGGTGITTGVVSNTFGLDVATVTIVDGGRYEFEFAIDFDVSVAGASSHFFTLRIGDPNGTFHPYFYTINDTVVRQYISGQWVITSAPGSQYTLKVTKLLAGGTSTVQAATLTYRLVK